MLDISHAVLTVSHNVPLKEEKTQPMTMEIMEDDDLSTAMAHRNTSARTT